MTTFDTDVFGAADGGSGGGTGVVKYRPGLMVKYGDEVKSLKDLEVYVRWSKTPEVLTLSVDPADDYVNFKSSTGLCPIGSTTPYIKTSEANSSYGLIRYKGGLYVHNNASGSPTTVNLKGSRYRDQIDKKFIQAMIGPDNGRPVLGVPVLSSYLTGDFTPSGKLVFYSLATTGNAEAHSLVGSGFYISNGQGADLFRQDVTKPVILASVNETTHFWFHQEYGIQKVTVTSDNFITVRELVVNTSLTKLNSTSLLSFVKTTSGRFFLTLGYDPSGAPKGDISTSDLTYPFFYELVFNSDYTAASLVGINQPIATPDSTAACVVGQVELLSIKNNKIAVLFSYQCCYIYDVDTGEFLRTFNQGKTAYSSGANNPNDRRTLKNHIAYDSVNDILYTLLLTGKNISNLQYLIHDLKTGDRQAVMLTNDHSSSSTYLINFGGFTCIDGSLFGNLVINTNGGLLTSSAYNHLYINAGMVFARAGLNQQYVKQFENLPSTLSRTEFWVIKLGHRYDQIVHVSNTTMREVTTTQHHMPYEFAHKQYASPNYTLEEYMFRIF